MVFSKKNMWEFLLSIKLRRKPISKKKISKIIFSQLFLIQSRIFSISTGIGTFFQIFQIFLRNNFFKVFQKWKKHFYLALFNSPKVWENNFFAFFQLIKMAFGSLTLWKIWRSQCSNNYQVRIWMRRVLILDNRQLRKQQNIK